jgi:hypothetical protein
MLLSVQGSGPTPYLRISEINVKAKRTQFCRRGAETPEVLKYTLPSKIEGAGKTGCALHPRSRRQLCIKKCAHEHTGSAENTRPPPRNGFTAYTSSPW